MNSRKFFERFGFSYEHPGYLELRLGTERFTIGAGLCVQVTQVDDEVCVWDQTAETKEQALALCVAYRFATALRAYLGEQKFEQMRRLNATETDKNICHSHDFCDANVFIDEVLSEFGVTLVGKTDFNQQALDLANLAWDLAKARGLLKTEVAHG